MSTRSTICYGDNFHLYHELLDNSHNVHLRIDGCDKCHRSSTIKIPIDVWETIRKHAGIEFDLANKSEEEIAELATKEVEERIAEYKSAKTKSAKALMAFCGSFVYGSAKDPKLSQIKRGIKYLMKERTFQLTVLEKVKKHEAKNKK